MGGDRNLETAWRWPWRGVALAALFFTGLTYAFYYPFVHDMASGLEHLGDPALTAWILNWDLHALSTRPLEIWQSNIFYPYENTLALSENLIAPSILLLPFHAFTKNPILLYNISLFTGIVLSGVCAFLLAHYLTRSWLLSLVPGIAFAFSPFMLAHGSHLQMQHAYWIPLLFLCIYRYFDKLNCGGAGRRYCLVWGAVFLALQFLSNAYYFVFLATVIVLFLIYRIYRTRCENRKTAMVETAGFWLSVFVLVLPFAWPYLKVHHELGFDRGIEEIKYFSADIVNYLAYNDGNVWFGSLTSAFADHQLEKYITPGIVVGLLAVLPILVWSTRPGRIGSWWREYGRHPLRFHVVDALIVLALAMLIYILSGNDLAVTRDGDVVKLLGVKLKMTRPGNTVCYLLVLLGVRMGMSLRMRGLPKGIFASEKAFYAALAVFAFLMSLGPAIRFADHHLLTGPYDFFYRYLPGYGGLRVPARFALFVVFGMSILGVLNIDSLLRKISSRSIRNLILFSLPLLLIAEFYSHPRQVRYRPVKRDVDVWLRDAPEGSAVELPLSSHPKDFSRDLRAVFHSVWHWKPIFNGYSGYTPPSYHAVSFYTESFPSELAARILNRIGIDYVVSHHRLPNVIDDGGQWFDMLAEFDDAVVLSPKDVPNSIDGAANGELSEVDPRLWRVTEAVPQGKGRLPNLNDGNIETVWHIIRSQEPGDSITIELDRETRLNALELHFGDMPYAFPRSFKLQTMDETGQWSDVVYEYDPVQFVDSILKSPRNSFMRILLPDCEARALRLVTTAAAIGYNFGMAEIKLYIRDD